MNKKLLVSAMGLALAGGMSLANADVQLYGQLDVSVDATDVDGGRDDVNLGSNRSSVGFKGSEDLGGLTALFKSEWQIDVDDAGQGPGTNEDDTTEGGTSNGFKARDQYVGFKGGFGRILFGQLSTAYKSPGSKIDPWYRTRLQSRNVGLQSTLHKGRGEEGQGRAQNTIRYDSPKWSGLGLTGTYTLDNNETDSCAGGAAQTACQEDDNPWSAGITYGGHGVYAFASYLTTSGGGDDAAYQVGAKYTIAGLTVRGIYEKDDGLITLNQGKSAKALNGGATSSLNEGTGDGLDIWSVGVDYKIANNLVSLDYGQALNSNNVQTNAGATQVAARDNYQAWRLGAQHMFSKRTKVYLGYSNLDGDDSCCGESEILSLGMRHNF